MNEMNQNIEKNIECGMSLMFRNRVDVKPLSEKEIKTLARQMYEQKVVNVSDENILNIPFGSICISSLVLENDIHPKDVCFVASLDRGLCASMRIILGGDWDKALDIYRKALAVFEDKK